MSNPRHSKKAAEIAKEEKKDYKNMQAKMKRYREFQKNEEIIKKQKEEKLIENHLKQQLDVEMKKLAEEKKKNLSEMHIEDSTIPENK